MDISSDVSFNLGFTLLNCLEGDLLSRLFAIGTFSLLRILLRSGDWVLCGNLDEMGVELRLDPWLILDLRGVYDLGWGRGLAVDL